MAEGFGPEAQAVSQDDTGLRPVSVEQGSLSAGTVLSGTLSRGTAEPLNASAEGILTWLPAAGDSVRPGQRLFEWNGQPTFLLQGKVPLWRPLQLGAQGKDVLSLNRALADAGFLDESLADDLFGQGTSGALARLYESAHYLPPSRTEVGVQRTSSAQRAADAAQEVLQEANAALTAAQAEAAPVGAVDEPAKGDATAGDPGAVPLDTTALKKAVTSAQGKVDDALEDLEIARAENVSPADVVILDLGRMRVQSVPLRVGDPASGTVLEWTGTRVHAQTQVTRSQQAALATGDRVTVTLPDGAEVGGAIGQTIAAGLAETPEGDTAGEGSDLVTVRVDLDGQDKVTGLVGAAVRIEVVTARVEDALVVPVTALVALAEGGYAVEKVMPDSPPGSGLLVPVEVGLLAEAKVQVTSAQLRPGDEVLVP
ncbi:efflux RND transporter periplasmic adaptor subunit [Promicromonospora xylanilytica]